MVGVSDILEQRYVSEVLLQCVDIVIILYFVDGFLICIFDFYIILISIEEVSDFIKLYMLGDKLVKICVFWCGFYFIVGFVCLGVRGSIKLEYDVVVDFKIMDEVDGVILIILFFYFMNYVVFVEVEQYKFMVEVGMMLLGLVDVVEVNNMLVFVGVFFIYGNLILGGVILIFVYGLGLGIICSFGDLVIKVKWVNVRGDIIVSDVQMEKGVNEVKVLVGGLGFLGIIMEFILQL